jgi:hypothetical protein
MSVALPPRRYLLRLYRDCMSLATRFPSKKRASIVHEVRETFRRNRGETDPNKIRSMCAEGHDGITYMRTYVDFRRTKGSWTLKLGHNQPGSLL